MPHELLHKMGDISSSKGHRLDVGANDVAVSHRNDVCHSISNIKHQASQSLLTLQLHSVCYFKLGPSILSAFASIHKRNRRQRHWRRCVSCHNALPKKLCWAKNDAMVRLTSKLLVEAVLKALKRVLWSLGPKSQTCNLGDSQDHQSMLEVIMYFQ